MAVASVLFSPGWVADHGRQVRGRLCPPMIAVEQKSEEKCARQGQIPARGDPRCTPAPRRTCLEVLNAPLDVAPSSWSPCRASLFGCISTSCKHVSVQMSLHSS